LRAAAERSDAFDMLGKCMEVASADTILIQQAGETRWVRLLGVEAPRAEGNADQAARLGWTEEEVARAARVSRNTLSAWIYRRGLRVEYPLGEDFTDHQGRPFIYAEVAGLDLSRKLLQGGQVFASDIDHPRRDLYRALEQEARERQLGIWRVL